VPSALHTNPQAAKTVGDSRAAGKFYRESMGSHPFQRYAVVLSSITQLIFGVGGSMIMAAQLKCASVF